MRLDWSTATDGSLSDSREDRVYELYHENSKLFLQTAQDQAEMRSANPFELFVSSRGFRRFTHRPGIDLPDPLPSNEALSDILWRRRSGRELSGPIEIEELATLLRQALGPTAIVQNKELGIAQSLRAWPSAGALYPLDTYVIANRVRGLPAGVYHFNPLPARLELLPSRGVAEV